MLRQEIAQVNSVIAYFPFHFHSQYSPLHTYISFHDINSKVSSYRYSIFKSTKILYKNIRDDALIYTTSLTFCSIWLAKRLFRVSTHSNIYLVFSLYKIYFFNSHTFEKFTSLLDIYGKRPIYPGFRLDVLKVFRVNFQYFTNIDTKKSRTNTQTSMKNILTGIYLSILYGEQCAH
jgi:hypothetical protein